MVYNELGEVRWAVEAQGARRIYTALWVADADGFAQKEFPIPLCGLLLEMECLNYGAAGTWDARIRDEYKIDLSQGAAAGLSKGFPAVRRSVFVGLGAQRVAGALVDGPAWLTIAAASGDHGVVRVVVMALDAEFQTQRVVGPPAEIVRRAEPAPGCNSCGG